MHKLVEAFLVPCLGLNPCSGGKSRLVDLSVDTLVADYNSGTGDEGP